MIKMVLFDWQFYNYIKRYWETYHTLNQVEIWIMLITAIKITVVVPDYVFQEINWLFWVFVVNSIVTYWMSHLLHMRKLMINQGSVCAGRWFVALFVFRILLILAIIFAGPVFDNLSRKHDRDYSFKLECTKGCPYPIRFSLIFLVDFFAATLDLLIFVCSPKTQNKQERLKEMRIATIDAGVRDRTMSKKEHTKNDGKVVNKF